MASVEQLKKQNAELRQMIANHDDDIIRCKYVIYQLVRGLFNEKTQKSISRAHNNVLNGREYDQKKEDDEEDEEDEEDE